MELIRLRKRLLLAIRGHKLLQDKLEEMMRRFGALLKDIEGSKNDFTKKMQSISKDLLYCRVTSSQKHFEEIISNVSADIQLKYSEANIMNVRMPIFTLRESRIEKNYNFFTTPAQMDMALAKTQDFIRSVLKLGQLLKTLDTLSYEIERTRRRVNALEYILIPSINETIRYISQKLNEFERANLVRLMRVKEIVRAH
jgi:V/A-type H+-transporting ATPase subunit D